MHLNILGASIKDRHCLKMGSCSEIVVLKRMAAVIILCKHDTLQKLTGGSEFIIYKMKPWFRNKSREKVIKLFVLTAKQRNKQTKLRKNSITSRGFCLKCTYFITLQ